MNNKKYTACFLLLLAIIPLSFSILFVLNQQIAKHKMMEKLEHEMLTTFTFTQQQIKWIIPGKELLVNGKLFDVKKYIQKNNCFEITGLFDEEEQVAKESYLKLLHNKTDTIPFKKLMGKLFFNSVFSPPGNEISINKYYRISPIIFCIFSEKLIFKFYPVNAPPPDSRHYI